MAGELICQSQNMFHHLIPWLISWFVILRTCLTMLYHDWWVDLSVSEHVWPCYTIAGELICQSQNMFNRVIPWLVSWFVSTQNMSDHVIPWLVSWFVSLRTCLTMLYHGWWVDLSVSEHVWPCYTMVDFVNTILSETWLTTMFMYVLWVH